MRIIKYLFSVALLGAGFVLLESKRELKKIKKRYIKINSYDNNADNSHGKPVRLAFLADYHEAENGYLNEKIESIIKEASPDMIMIAGDLINGHDDESIEPVRDLLYRINNIATTYISPGNHEKKAKVHYYKNEKIFEDLMYIINDCDNITYLENDVVTVEHDGKPINIYGLDIDLRFYRRSIGDKLKTKDVFTELGKPKEGYNILLAHNPEYFEEYAEWRADLALSGHFHGGIVNIPFVGGAITPRLKMFPKYTKGIYESEYFPKRKMYLTSGLGQHSLKIKINNIPEIVIIDINI